MKDQTEERLIEAKSFSCMTSDEAIRIFLSRNPVSFTITEIAQNLGYHRNTTKKAIQRMNEIDSVGSGNYTKYYTKSMMDHYREIAEASKVAYDMLSNTSVSLKEYIRSFGYALVKENLEKTISEEYISNYNHSRLRDSLIHLKMSYPFEDIIETKMDNGTVELTSSVKFYIVSESPETVLRVSSCLCNGHKTWEYLCEMVAGGLQAGLNFACQLYSSKIRHIKCEKDGSCLFEITNTETTEEDETALDDFL